MTQHGNSPYGMPYQGSKGRIAKKLIMALPAGERFVDLFGGGAAMTQAAAESGRYKKVWYNDYNPLLVQTVTDAIHGKYNPAVFTPQWISREDFMRLKDTDGYVKWIWSFANNGLRYFCNEDLEPIKRAGHMLVVFGEPSDLLESLAKGICKAVKGKTIHDRRLAYKAYMRKCEQADFQEQLPRLERLGALQQLQQWERLGALQLSCKDYREYGYQYGDIVYCDIPYPDTYGYENESFDFGAFYEWADRMSVPVYFSGYDNIADDRFKIVWAKSKINLYAVCAGRREVTECLYTQAWNDDGLPRYMEGKQLTLFD